MKTTFSLGLAVIIGSLQSTYATDNQDAAAYDDADITNPDCDLFDSEMPAFDSLEEDEDTDTITTEIIEMPDYDTYDFSTDNAYLPVYNVLPTESLALDTYETPTESIDSIPGAEQTEVLEPYTDNLSKGSTFGHSIILTLGSIMFFI